MLSAILGTWKELNKMVAAVFFLIQELNLILEV